MIKYHYFVLVVFTEAPFNIPEAIPAVVRYEITTTTYRPVIHGHGVIYVPPISCYDDEIEFNGECVPKIKSSVIAKPFDLSIFGKN